METFVVRVWRPAIDEVEGAPPPLTGVVEHIGTGRSDRFQGVDGLAELIASALAQAPSRSERDGAAVKAAWKEER